jgi:hypothetical protein
MNSMSDKQDVLRTPVMPDRCAAAAQVLLPAEMTVRESAPLPLPLRQIGTALG